MVRSLDESIRQRSDAFDAGDAVLRDGLRNTYLDQALPDHVKAALRDVARTKRPAPGADPTMEANDEAGVGQELMTPLKARKGVPKRFKAGSKTRVGGGRRSHAPGERKDAKIKDLTPA